MGLRRGVELTQVDSIPNISRNHAKLVRFSDGIQEEFDTVLFATGRKPETRTLFGPHPEAHGVQLDKCSEKLLVDQRSFLARPPSKKSMVDLYAIGDWAQTSSPEFTPVAMPGGHCCPAYCRVAFFSTNRVTEKRAIHHIHSDL